MLLGIQNMDYMKNNPVMSESSNNFGALGEYRLITRTSTAKTATIYFELIIILPKNTNFFKTMFCQCLKFTRINTDLKQI